MLKTRADLPIISYQVLRCKLQPFLLTFNTTIREPTPIKARKEDIPKYHATLLLLPSDDALALYNGVGFCVTREVALGIAVADGEDSGTAVIYEVGSGVRVEAGVAPS
jgi:hypothetical protein